MNNAATQPNALDPRELVLLRSHSTASLLNHLSDNEATGAYGLAVRAELLARKGR